MTDDRKRAAIFMDLENLLFPYREAGLLEQGLLELDRYIDRLATRLLVVGITVVCNPSLCRTVLGWMRRRGIRPFLHAGGPDAADIELCERLMADVPSSCTTIVIASGDGRFLEPAVNIRATGRRVEVLAPRGSLAATVRLAADRVDLLTVPSVPKEAA